MTLSVTDYRECLLKNFRHYRRSGRYTPIGAYRMALRMTAMLPEDRETKVLRETVRHYPRAKDCYEQFDMSPRECWAMANRSAREYLS